MKNLVNLNYENMEDKRNREKIRKKNGTKAKVKYQRKVSQKEALILHNCREELSLQAIL